MVEIHGIQVSQEPEECQRWSVHPEELCLVCLVCGRKVPLAMRQFHPGPERITTVRLAGFDRDTFDLFGHLFTRQKEQNGVATYKHTESVVRKKAII